MKVTFKTTAFEQACGEPEEKTVTDILENKITRLERAEKRGNRDTCRRLLKEIKDILKEESNVRVWKPEDSYFRTLTAVHKAIRSNTIRLRYEYMNISGYFKLLVNVRDRLFNQSATSTKVRTVVAEEMAKLNLYPQVLATSFEVKYESIRPPNRAFMDILNKINPELAKVDLERRERAKEYYKQKVKK